MTDMRYDFSSVPIPRGYIGCTECGAIVRGETDCLCSVRESLARVRGLLQRIHGYFCWRVSPDSKGRHIVEDDVIRQTNKLCESGAESADIGKLDTVDETDDDELMPCGHFNYRGYCNAADDFGCTGCDGNLPPDMSRGSAETGGERAALKLSEWGRPIVYIAESSWYSGVASNQCVFSSREEAVRWAKDQGRGFLDWNTWAPRGTYPDCEFDSEQFDPTFFAKWDDGFVRATKTEVNELYDWAANFPRSSQSQTVSSGVEGAHEGITADKSEPEKLNNAQKSPVLFPNSGGIKEWITSDGKSWLNELAAEKHEVTLAESPLSSPPRPDDE